MHKGCSAFKITQYGNIEKRKKSELDGTKSVVVKAQKPDELTLV